MNGWSIFLFLIIYGLPFAALQKNKWSKEKRLQSELFENYDPYISPDQENRTVVKLGLLFGNYEYFERSGGLLIIQGFIRMSWTDKRLTWNETEKEVDGFEPEYEIWRPHITNIKDRGFEGEPIYHPHGKTEKSNNALIQSTIVHPEGQVTLVYKYRLTGKCIPNLMEWPKDSSTCEAFIGSEAVQNINLTTFSFFNAFIFLDFEADLEDWVVESQNETKLDLNPPKNGFDQIINITLVLKTSGSIFSSLLIFPGLGLAAMALILLILKFDNSIRLATLGISFIIHTYLLQIIAFHMPPCGTQPPYLVMYFYHSLLITGLVVVETLAVKSVATIRQMPKSAAIFLRYLENCRIFHLLVMPRQQIYDENVQGAQPLDPQGETHTKMIVKNKSWELIALLIDRLMLFSVILAYFFNILHFLLF